MQEQLKKIAAEPAQKNEKINTADTSDARSDSDRFLLERRDELRDRVLLDADHFFEENGNVLYGLRTLAAAIELGILDSPPDEEFANKVSEASKRTDTFIIDAFTQNAEKAILHGMGILSDRMTVMKWADIQKTGKPLISENTREQMLKATEEYLLGDSWRLSHGIHDLSIMLRVGIWDEIPERDRERISSSVSEHLESIAQDNIRTLEMELNKAPNIDPSDWIVPKALYGLFVLSDIKTIMEHVPGKSE